MPEHLSYLLKRATLAMTVLVVQASLLLAGGGHGGGGGSGGGGFGGHGGYGGGYGHGGYGHGGYGHGGYGGRGFYGRGYGYGYGPYFGFDIGFGYGYGYGVYVPYYESIGYVAYSPVVSASPTFAEPPLAATEGQPPPSASAGSQPSAPAEGRPPPDNAAHLRLLVPENAEVWIAGTKSPQTGTVLEVASPPLTPGKRYLYTIEVRRTDANGKPVVDQRKIRIRANDWFSIDFTRPEPKPLPLPLPLPVPEEKDGK